MYKESEIIELKSKVTSNLCKEIIAFAKVFNITYEDLLND